jgi:hypothetical protein
MAARTLGVQLLSLGVQKLGDLENGFQAALSGRADAIMNLKTAKTLGLTIPPSVLARADRGLE